MKQVSSRYYFCMKKQGAQTKLSQLEFLLLGIKRYLKIPGNLSESKYVNMTFICQEKEITARELITIKDC